MLDVYTVSFFGHRELPNMFAIEDKLMSILREIINTHEYVEFLVGRDGDFDQLCSSCVRRAIADYACGIASLILVLPYERADYRNNKESYERNIMTRCRYAVKHHRFTRRELSLRGISR